MIEANFNSSRVILLTDINSRVPILVGENLTQAILVGDPSVKSKLSLQYLPRTHKLKHGDRIYTSNIDGILKKGILIGSINQIPQIDNVEKESLKIQNNNTNKIKIKQNFEIQLGHDPYQLDYVSIFIDKK